ncbi:MAG: hypothetical protein RJA22_1667 [Verrucomicrobiota bacterium]|jgi:hypothetical protein
MFGTIRKHQQWLWVIVIFFVTIAMVFFFTTDSWLQGGDDDGGGDFGRFNDRPISKAEFLAARREILTASVIRTAKLPPGDAETSNMIEQQAAARVFAKWVLKRNNIEPSDKAVARMVQEQLRDFPYATFENDFLKPNGLSTLDYERFVRHEVGVLQLMAAAGASAKLVGAREAEVIYRKEHQETEAQLALFLTSNYVSKVTITNGAIEGFYTNRMLMYRVPERTLLGYVEFPASNYLAEAEKAMSTRTNIEEIVNTEFFRRDTNDVRWQDAKGAPLSEADTKKKIRELIRENFFALPAARRAAAEFGTLLMEGRGAPGMDEKNPQAYANFEKLAAARGLVIKTTAPFDAVNGLEEFAAPTNTADQAEEPYNLREVVRRAALELRDTNAVRFTPIPGPGAVYLIARKGSLPAETPALAQVGAKVTNDYRNFMAATLARNAGMAFATNLTNLLAQKKSFEDICKAEGVTLAKPPLFSDTTQSLTNFDARINIRLLQNFSRDLAPGQATGFLPVLQQEGGFVLHVKARPPLEDAKVKAALPEFISQLRNYRQNEAFNQWFRKQAEVAKFSPPRRETTIGAQN